MQIFELCFIYRLICWLFVQLSNLLINFNVQHSTDPVDLCFCFCFSAFGFWFSIFCTMPLATGTRFSSFIRYSKSIRKVASVIRRNYIIKFQAKEVFKTFKNQCFCLCSGVAKPKFYFNGIIFMPHHLTLNRVFVGALLVVIKTLLT